MADEAAYDKLEKVVKLIIRNPTVRRSYFTNPLRLLARMVPHDEQQAELGDRVEEAISQDTKLKDAHEAHFGDYGPARLIAHNPKLRTEYFGNPGKVLARAIPWRWWKRISLVAPEDIRDERAKLGEKVEAVISGDSRLISQREAAVEKNAFLNEALQNPQRTFNAIFWLSILAFGVALAFLVGAFLAAWLGNSTEEKAVLGGLSGGGGVVATLGTVLAMSRDSIRKANGDNAQIRLILTSFATILTHYRAIPIQSFTDAHVRNKAIREVVSEAVEQIEKLAEPPEERLWSAAEAQKAAAETEKSTAEAQKSAAETEKSTAEAQKSAAEAQKLAAEKKK